MPFIGITDKITTLKKNLQLAAIYHEIGHIENKHTLFEPLNSRYMTAIANVFSKNKDTIIKRNIEQEQAADLFAAQHTSVDDVIELLESIKNLNCKKSSNPIRDIGEINKRINYLKENWDKLK